MSFPWGRVPLCTQAFWPGSPHGQCCMDANRRTRLGRCCDFSLTDAQEGEMPCTRYPTAHGGLDCLSPSLGLCFAHTSLPSMASPPLPIPQFGTWFRECPPQKSHPTRIEVT